MIDPANIAYFFSNIFSNPKWLLSFGVVFIIINRVSGSVYSFLLEVVGWGLIVLACTKIFAV